VLAVVVALMASGCSEDDRSPVTAFEAVTSRDGQVVDVSVNSCNASPRAEVTAETDDEVRFKVEAYDSADDCADGVSLCLSAPLGDRDLVDETSGDVIEVRIEATSAVACATPVED
jgi:hypothetical protein